MDCRPDGERRRLSGGISMPGESAVTLMCIECALHVLRFKGSVMESKTARLTLLIDPAKKAAF